MGDRKSVDPLKNCQGQFALIECMQSSDLCFMNRCKGHDDLTYVSSKGCLVVDYCLVPTEDPNYIDDFAVTTMSKCEAALCADEEGYCIPDHSALTWRVLVVDYINGSSYYTHNSVLRKTSETNYVVPEEYMPYETSFTQNIIYDLKLVAGDQVRLDVIYVW